MQKNANNGINVTVSKIPADLTMGQLIEMLDKNEDKKAPSARKLLSSDTSILLGVEMGGITINVYENGYALFIRKAEEKEEYEEEQKKDRMSVKRVGDCKSIWYPAVITDEEMEYERMEGCTPVRRVRNGVEESFMVLSGEPLLGLPWSFVLYEIGQLALDHNQEEREHSKVEGYVKGDDDEIYGERTMLPGFEQEYFDEQERRKRKLARKWNAKKAIDSLTDKQREVVELYAKHKNQEMVACELGIRQSAVSKHLNAARVKIEKSMRENQKYFEEKAEKVLWER